MFVFLLDTIHFQFHLAHTVFVGHIGNELRLMMPRLVQKINNYAGQSLVKEIVFSKRWEKSGTDGIAEIVLASSQAKASEENLAKVRQKITLSKAELKVIDQITADVVDADIKAKAAEICRKD